MYSTLAVAILALAGRAIAAPTSFDLASFQQIYPAVCYDICNDAYLEKKQSGRTCDNTAFLGYYHGCRQCISENWRSVSGPQGPDPSWASIIYECDPGVPIGKKM